ncbi:hypothetical protein COLO4_05784 [Corchorus olitorius]|uniref:Uncharacterized protein n=1 Tax=Corchorus olitorius TaxID=93759 RepID=A0A1R3KQ37_9ROSI|nr:hypothetical protein COLO4_05784 [Corchorus olitorius]
MGREEQPQATALARRTEAKQRRRKLQPFF